MFVDLNVLARVMGEKRGYILIKKRKEGYQFLGQRGGSGVRGAHPEKANLSDFTSCPLSCVHTGPYSGQTDSDSSYFHRSRNTLV